MNQNTDCFLFRIFLCSYCLLQYEMLPTCAIAERMSVDSVSLFFLIGNFCLYLKATDEEVRQETMGQRGMTSNKG